MFDLIFMFYLYNYLLQTIYIHLSNNQIYVYRPHNPNPLLKQAQLQQVVEDYTQIDFDCL